MPCEKDWEVEGVTYRFREPTGEDEIEARKKMKLQDPIEEVVQLLAIVVKRVNGETLEVLTDEFFRKMGRFTREKFIRVIDTFSRDVGLVDFLQDLYPPVKDTNSRKSA